MKWRQREDVTWAGLGRLAEVKRSTFQAERRASPEVTRKKPSVLRECQFTVWPDAQGECGGEGEKGARGRLGLRILENSRGLSGKTRCDHLGLSGPS